MGLSGLLYLALLLAALGEELVAHTTGSYNTDDSLPYGYSTYDWRHTANSPQCGSRTNLVASYDSLYSPNYPSYYPDNLHCMWEIDPGQEVYLKVALSDLETCCDHLTIIDENGTAHKALYRLTLQGSWFRVLFTTDGSGTERGFEIHWSPDHEAKWYTNGFADWTLPPRTQPMQGNNYQNTGSPGCGDTYRYETVGELFSPNYPDNYPNNENCLWHIIPGRYVHLRVMKGLHLETCCDHLQIISDTGETLGDSTNPYGYIGGNSFTVNFTSDGSNTEKGFLLRWSDDTYLITGVGPHKEPTTSPRYSTKLSTIKTTQGSTIVPGCGNTYRYGVAGELSSPNYPGYYSNNENCQWHIHPGRYVYLRVMDLHLESGYDHLEIVSDTGETLHDSKNGYIGGNSFSVSFTSDGSNTRQGFLLRWSDEASTTPTWRGSTYDWYHSTPTWRGSTYDWYHSTQPWWYSTRNWRYSTSRGESISVQCDPRNVNVVVPRNLIRQMFPGVSEYDLSLNNPNCRGQVYYDVVMFKTDIHGCGMTREETYYDVIYENRIRPIQGSNSYTTRGYYYGSTRPAITRFDSSDIKVECRFDRYITAVGHYQPQSVNEVVARGRSNFTAYMDFYRDYSYNYRIYSYPAHLTLDQDVYVDLRLDAVDSDLKIAPSDCYAAPTSSRSNYYDRYYLIRNGCLLDQTVAFELAPSHHLHFRFRAFEFLKDRDDVYLYCSVRVCNDSDFNTRCRKGSCPGRFGRDTSSVEEEPESKDHDFQIFQGPLKLRSERSAETGGQQKTESKVTSSTLPAAIMGVSAVAMVIAAVAMVITRRNRNQGNENTI